MQPALLGKYNRNKERQKGSGNINMGCCEFELLELSQYQVVSKIKNQYRTKNFRDKIRCCQCDAIIEHEFSKKKFLGFTVRIKCPGCGWRFEG